MGRTSPLAWQNQSPTRTRTGTTRTHGGRRSGTARRAEWGNLPELRGNSGQLAGNQLVERARGRVAPGMRRRAGVRDARGEEGRPKAHGAADSGGRRPLAMSADNVYCVRTRSVCKHGHDDFE